MVKILNRHDLEVRNQKDHYQKQFEASSLNQGKDFYKIFRVWPLNCDHLYVIKTKKGDKLEINLNGIPS